MSHARIDITIKQCVYTLVHKESIYVTTRRNYQYLLIQTWLFSSFSPPQVRHTYVFHSSSTAVSHITKSLYIRRNRRIVFISIWDASLEIRLEVFICVLIPYNRSCEPFLGQVPKIFNQDFEKVHVRKWNHIFYG